MKCPACGADHKTDTGFCRKCGKPLVCAPVWKPGLSWHLKTLGIIYACLIIIFFVLNALLKPYLRTLPADITPWLQRQK